MSTQIGSRQATGSHRITQLDGLRGIAIAMVFCFHAYKIPGLWTGVDLFFVLSGFLITGILFNQKDKPFGSYIGHFYMRRARRILPPYAIVLVVTGLIFGFGFLRYWYEYIGIMNLEMLRWFSPGPATLPLWSLAVEEQFYLLWPLAVYVLRRRQLIALAALLLVISPVLRYFCTPLFADQGPIYMWLPFRMDTLAAGALIGLLWPTIRDKVKSSAGAKRMLVAVVAVAMVLAFAGFGLLHRLGYKTTANTPIGNSIDYSATLVMMAGLLILALVGVGARFLQSWPMIWLGRISFSVYLIHLTVLEFAPHHSPLIAAMGAIGYATVLWFLVEKPMTSAGQSKEKVLVTATTAA
jgi:peptidoglycan/LPS O-acetylase OafA/YrhL